MSLPNNTDDKVSVKRVDPVVDAYRQASEHESAGPTASVRAVVLAHAQLAAAANAKDAQGAQSPAYNTPKATAANDHSWMWRAAAGLVLGVLGVLMFQWMRPAGTNTDTAVAAASAPTSATESAAPSQSAPSSPASVAPTAAPVASTASADIPAQPEAAAQASIAAASTIETNRPVTRADSPSVSDEIALASARDASVARSASRAIALPPPASATAAEPHVAAAPVMGADVAVASPAITAAPRAEAPPRETTAVAMAKRVRVADERERQSKNEDAVASVHGLAGETPRSAANATASGPAAAAPMASGAMNAATAPVAIPAKASITPDADLLRAIRQDDAMLLRSAIARGANVNAKNELGRSALQFARDENHDALVEILLAAGAR